MTAKRFLLVTWEGGGVIPPELGLARRLIARGHQVHVLADPTITEEAEAAGCAFTPWTTAPHCTSRAPDGAIIKDWQFRNPLSMMKVYLRDFLGGPAPRWASDVDAVLGDGSFDAVLVDFALPAAKIPAEARGIPIIGIMPNCWMLPTKGIPPFGTGWMPSHNPLAKSRDALVRAMATRMFNRALPPLNATRADFGLPPVASTHQQILTGPMLLLTSPSFDFTSPHQPDNAVYAGPVLDDPSWAPDYQSPWPPDDPRPLVLVSLSSGFQDQIDVLNRIADALSTLPVRAVITLGQSVDIDAVPSRSAQGDVVVVPAAPHAAILRHAAAVVTHAGHGTTMKALAAGVPVVCIPMGRDQHDNAARVVHHGAGVRLKANAKPARIAGAVDQVLNDDRFRRCATELGRAITSLTGCVDPVVVIDAVSSPRGLRTSSRDRSGASRAPRRDPPRRLARRR